MPAMAASVTSNAAIAELHQSLRFMLKRWRESRQASEHDVKPSLDPIRGYLAKVDSKLSEMMLWDEILLEITRRPGLCCGHGALITLLKALRSQITDLTSAVALLTSEAKKRAAYDWTLDELSKRKSSIQRQTSEALKNLQSEVHREAKKAERWQSYVAKIQESMTNTMENVDFGPSVLPILAATGQQTEAYKSFRESKQPLLPATPLKDELNDHASTALPAVAMKTLQGEDILVTPISNGDRIITSLTSGSAYYRFEVRDSAGLSIAISQSPAGDTSNFTQVLFARDSIPTSLSHAYHIKTRQAKHGFLQLCPNQAASGTWYIKVTGIGIKTKKICLELRLSMALHKEANNQSNLLAEIVNEVEAQQVLTNRLNALEHVSMKTTQAIIDGINSRSSCASIAVQTSPQSEAERPILSAHKPIVVKSQLGYFAPLLTLPVPESLRRSSLRATLRLILNLYTQRVNTTDPNETLCQFIYRLYIKRYNEVKLAETTLAELLSLVKTRRWMHIPRIQMFGRLCGVFTMADQPSLDHHDATFVMSVMATIKRALDGPVSANHNHRLDDIDGNIILQRPVAQQVVDSFLVNDSAAFKANTLKLATNRTQELSKGKLRSGDSIDGDALIEVIHQQWKDENCISDHHLKQLFMKLNSDRIGWLDFARFVAVWNLVIAVEPNPSLIIRQPQYSSVDLILIYKQMLEISCQGQSSISAGLTSNESNRAFEISLDAFISVCHSFGIVTKRYAETRISFKDSQEVPIAIEDGNRSSTLPLVSSRMSTVTISSAGTSSSSPASNWNQIVNDWKKLEQLVLHEVGHIRDCKFPGQEDVWNALNKFKTELRLRRDLGAATMTYRNLMDVLVRVVNESPIVPYRNSNRTDD